jgi:hypothetical protein
MVVLSGVSVNLEILAFQLYYSFHPEGRVPYKTNKTIKTFELIGIDMYNCSVDYFPMFRKHLDCSGIIECERGEDESDHCYACQFTHPADTGLCPFCPGGVAAPRNGKCYSFELVTNAHEAKDFNEFLPLARKTCQLKGGRVAFPKNPLDLDTLQLSAPDIHTMNKIPTLDKSPNLEGLQDGWPHQFFLGMMYGGLSTPNLYRQMWHGADMSVLHGMNIFQYSDVKNTVVPYIPLNIFLQIRHPVGFVSCAYSDAPLSGYAIYSACVIHQYEVCEFDLQPPRKEEIELHTMPLSPSLVRGGLVLLCPHHHLTHVFLRCDTRAHCGQLQPTPTCSLSNATHSLSAGTT